MKKFSLQVTLKKYSDIIPCKITKKYLLQFEEKLHLNFMPTKYSRTYCMTQRERGRDGEGVSERASEQKEVHMRAYE